MHFTTKTENLVKKQEFVKIKDGDICEYLLKIEFEGKQTPKRFSILWEEEQIDISSFWSSRESEKHFVSADWSPRQVESRTASELPLICLHNKADVNRVTVALSDTENPATLSAGTVEENGKIIMRIDLFSQLCPATESYEVIIRIDRRAIKFYDCIRDTRKWWSELGYKCATVPDSARLPMYSSWYSFHQNTIPEELLYECKLAKEYGMDTIIVDDGWQTDDNSRGYAFCGDWQVCERKIPDMKKLVDDVHNLGMKFMIWFSVPFVGTESKNYERFKGKYLRFKQRTGEAVLDPRFKEVRDFLTDIYVSSVKKYGWDGLKLDFIDSFTLTEDSSTDYESMDTVSVEQGVQLLLEEATGKLKEINPDIMIEFRQSYVGPAISKYGNMFRVMDCPNDPIRNKIYSLNLRLTSDTIAVHSDMLMWNKNETNEAVLYQLLAIMFAVPQISIRFDSITTDHKRILKNYLSFWRKHRDTLLSGELELFDAEANYTLAQSKRDGECVAVLYHNVVKRIEGTNCEYIFNATGKDGIYVDSDYPACYELYDMFGEKYECGAIQKGLNKLPLKNCQMVKIIR